MTTTQNVPTVRASGIAHTLDRRVELFITTDFTHTIDPDIIIAEYLMTVPEARSLYNTLQDALNVIDARSSQTTHTQSYQERGGRF